MALRDASTIVARQYEAYSYPAPLAEIPDGFYSDGDPTLYAPLIWPEGRASGPLNILVAGCGTIQAAALAKTNPQSRVTGIDLSEASLAHQRHLQERHGLSNLRLLQGDLLDVGDLGERFDLVVSTGVLHHMADPQAGLDALVKVLEPDGAMFLMVYGAARRVGVYLLQDAFVRMGLGQDAAGIALVRQTLAQLHPQHYVHWYAQRADDLAHDTGVVDTFLHRQDRAYHVPEVLAWIEAAGLEFQSWFDNLAYYPQGGIPRGPVFDHIVSLPDRVQWAVVENLTCVTGCHFLFARPRAFRINFEGEAWRGYRPVLRPGLARRGGDLFGRGDLEFQVTPAEAILLSRADGARTIAQIMEAPEFAAHADADRMAYACKTFELWWKLGHVLIKASAGGGATR